MADATCRASGCDAPQKVKSAELCGKHYQRLRNTGTTDPRPKSKRVYRECRLDSCTGTVVAHELCGKHYQRWHLHGSTDKPERGLDLCTIEGCGNPHLARGWCTRHYAAWKEYGVPQRPTREANRCSVEDCPRRYNGHGFCELHLRRHRAGTPLDAPIRGEFRQCNQAGCQLQAKSRGLCQRHYYDNFMRPRQSLYRANAKAKRLATPEQIRAQQRADYYQRNREHIRSQRKRQYDEAYAIDPSPWRAARDRRRARTKRRMTITERRTSLAYRRAIALDNCLYCGSTETHCIDHYFPLSKGGMDVWFNLVPACTECNASKHAKCGTKFALRRGPEVLARVFPSAVAA